MADMSSTGQYWSHGIAAGSTKVGQAVDPVAWDDKVAGSLVVRGHAPVTD